MQKIVLILLGMASLAASGIITDHVRGGLNVMGGLGIQLQGDHGLQGFVHHSGIGPEGLGSIDVNTLNHQQLLRQKFILDVLQQVNMPIQKQELLVLVNRNDVTNEELYMRPLTEEMHMVLNLIRQQRICNKQQICTISSKDHMQQMLGLYRLLVGARDFEAFQQLVVYGRQHINTEMFVNALILALAERQDTEMLVVPALHEILPQLYQHQSIIEQVQHLDTGVSTLRPSLVDVIGLGRQNRLLNNRLAEQQNSGLLGVLNRSQLWMPWRELHRQLAMRRMVGNNVVQQSDSQMNKLVIQLPGQGLLTDDIGLKAYVHVLIDELIVKQDVVGHSDDRNMNENTGRGMGMIHGLRNRMRNTLNDNDDDDHDQDNMSWNINNQRRTINNGGRMDRLFNVNRDDEDNMGGRRTGLNMDQDSTMDRRMGRVGLTTDDMNVQDRLRHRYSNDNDDDDQDNMSWNINNQRRTINNGGRMDRLFNVKRDDQDILGGRRTGLNMDQDSTMDRRMGRVGLTRDDKNVQDRLRHRYSNDNDDDDQDNMSWNINNQRRTINNGGRMDRLFNVNRDDQDNLGGRRTGLNMDQDSTMDKRMGRVGLTRDDKNVQDRLRHRYSNDNDDDDQDNMSWNMNKQRRTLNNGGRMDRLFNVKRDDQDILGGRRTGLNMDQDSTMDRRMGRVGLTRDDMNVQDRLIHRYSNDNDDDEDVYTGGRTMIGRNEGQRGINTVSANDARLLFVGRRRKNPNNVVNLSGGNRNYNSRNYYNMERDDMDMISGGRRVDRNEQHQQHSWQDNERDDDIRSNRKMTNERRMNNDYDDDEDVNQRQYHDQGHGQGYGTGHSIGGRTRNDFLSVVTRGSHNGWHMMQDAFDTNNRGRYMHGGGSLDMNLPTTTVDDERLLYVNRRKLNDNNDNQDGRMLNNRNYYHDDDDEDLRYGVHNNWMTNRRNEDEQNIHSGGRRYRRSLDQQQQQYWGQNLNRNDNTGINGKLLLHTLQQLVARINVERIAFGLPQLIDDQTTSSQHQGILGRILERINSNSNSNTNVNINYDTDRRVTVETLNKIEEIIQRVDRVLQQHMHQGQQTWSTINYNDKLNQIGLLLAGQVEDINLVSLMGEVLQQSQRELRRDQVANIIDNENIQILLAGIVKVIDDHVQDIYQNRQGMLSQEQDVIINNVQIDKLQTYLEQTEVDLSNLVQNPIDLSTQGNNKMIVGHVPRLNHKNFHIDIEVTSQRQQQVVVRSMLVPKVDGRGNILPVNQRRQNAILLDITTVDLHQGRNLIKLHSNDITLTSCDTTPYTKIYERVMLALQRQTQIGQQQICGQTDMLPHRLLVPRGHANGLPMQLVTVITPVQNTLNTMGRSITGLDVLLLDRLPLNYPLHCDTIDLNQVNAMPNVLVKDVQIYHDDNIQMNLMHLNY